MVTADSEGVLSATVMVTLQLPVFPAASVEVHANAVLPTLNVLPLLWLQDTVGEAGLTSVAVGTTKVMLAPDADVASTVCAEGQDSAGLILSMMMAVPEDKAVVVLERYPSVTKMLKVAGPAYALESTTIEALYDRPDTTVTPAVCPAIEAVGSVLGVSDTVKKTLTVWSALA